VAAIASPIAERLRWNRVFRWDLDKTYLRTEFDGLRNLARTALQKAHEKKSIPGARALMREIHASDRNLISIISGSPRQMRRVLERKLRMDGIQWDEFVLKPSLSFLLRGRFRALRDQIGYKLPVLLAGRIRVGERCPEVLFGDDAEADAFIYSVYADLLSDRMSTKELEDILDACTLYPDQRLRILDLAGTCPRGDAVERIFIYLAGGSPPVRFHPYGRRLIPISNYLQAALVLTQDGALQLEAVARVAHELLEEGAGPTSLRVSVEDVWARGLVREEILERVHGSLASSSDSQLASLFEPPGGASLPSDPPTGAIDYLNLVADTRRHRRSPRN
jgi:hypothetical protein